MAVGALALLVAAGLGAAFAAVLLRRHWLSEKSDPVAVLPATPGAASVRTHDMARLLEALPGAALLVDSSTGVVIKASHPAVALGIVSGERIAIPELQRMIITRKGEEQILEEEIHVKRAPGSGGRLDLLARVARLDPATDLVLVDNLSGARRVDEVRRDFVANVSHELKTPVGALSLLAEAVLSASDDPEAVQHFAGRMLIESARLASLVADLVDLSRLQGDDPMEHASPVRVDDVIAEAVDAIRLPAESGEIEIVSGGTSGLKVFGVEGQLVTAVRNLLANAVAYSPPHTRVAVASRYVHGAVEVSVTDQGIGIPEDEVGRIFERFYRVDQARSRVTGGTGLGLAIVKHVCRNHGGDVAVWSVEGAGSTFTLRLPAFRGSTNGTSAIDLKTLQGEKTS